MRPMTRKKIFTWKTSSYSQTTERNPLKPDHVLHETSYYVVTVSAVRCNVRTLLKQLVLKLWGRTFYVPPV